MMQNLGGVTQVFANRLHIIPGSVASLVLPAGLQKPESPPQIGEHALNNACASFSQGDLPE